jgi:hypothetical protein
MQDRKKKNQNKTAQNVGKKMLQAWENYTLQAGTNTTIPLDKAQLMLAKDGITGCTFEWQNEERADLLYRLQDVKQLLYWLQAAATPV